MAFLVDLHVLYAVYCVKQVSMTHAFLKGMASTDDFHKVHLLRVVYFISGSDTLVAVTKHRHESQTAQNQLVSPIKSINFILLILYIDIIWFSCYYHSVIDIAE
jgi:hypothetical protein